MTVSQMVTESRSSLTPEARECLELYQRMLEKVGQFYHANRHSREALSEAVSGAMSQQRTVDTTYLAVVSGTASVGEFRGVLVSFYNALMGAMREAMKEAA